MRHARPRPPDPADRPAADGSRLSAVFPAATAVVWALTFGTNLVEVARTHRYGAGVGGALLASLAWHPRDYLETAGALAAAWWLARRSRVAGGAAVLGLLAAALWIRPLQLAATFYSHDLLGGDTFRHAAVSFAFATPAMRAGLAGLAAASAALVAGGLARLTRSPGRRPRRREVVAWGLGPALLLAAGPLGPPRPRDPLPPGGRLSGFVRALGAHLTRPAPPRRDRLDEADLRALARYGISYPGPPEAPAWRAPRWDEPPPGPAPRNVLLVFFESLSARMVGAYNPAVRGWTPALDAAAAGGLIVEGYYNHASPTYLGLRGALCSWYPALGWEEWMALPPEPPRLLGVAEVLAGRGYTTAFLAPPPRSEGRFGEQLARYGFRERLLRERVLALAGADRRTAPHYPRDETLFRAARAWLEDRGEGPWFLAMLTVDTHPPYTPRAGAAGGAEGTKLGRVVGATDRAFGEFWRWFGRSRYAADTLVVLTADHPPSPSGHLVREPRLGRDYRPLFFDTIPLIFSGPGVPPGGRLAVPSNAADLAPSLLHRLGVRVASPFQGASLFGPRPPGPRGLVGVKVEHRFRVEPGGARSQRRVDGGSPGGRGSPEDGLVARWLAYQRGLIPGGRVRPAAGRGALAGGVAGP